MGKKTVLAAVALSLLVADPDHCLGQKRAILDGVLWIAKKTGDVVTYMVIEEMVTTIADRIVDLEPVEGMHAHVKWLGPEAPDDWAERLQQSRDRAERGYGPDDRPDVPRPNERFEYVDAPWSPAEGPPTDMLVAGILFTPGVSPAGVRRRMDDMPPPTSSPSVKGQAITEFAGLLCARAFVFFARGRDALHMVSNRAEIQLTVDEARWLVDEFDAQLREECPAAPKAGAMFWNDWRRYFRESHGVDTFPRSVTNTRLVLATHDGHVHYALHNGSNLH